MNMSNEQGSDIPRRKIIAGLGVAVGGLGLGGAAVTGNLPVNQNGSGSQEDASDSGASTATETYDATSEEGSTKDNTEDNQASQHEESNVVEPAEPIDGSQLVFATPTVNELLESESPIYTSTDEGPQTIAVSQHGAKNNGKMNLPEGFAADDSPEWLRTSLGISNNTNVEYDFSFVNVEGISPGQFIKTSLGFGQLSDRLEDPGNNLERSKENDGDNSLAYVHAETGDMLYLRAGTGEIAVQPNLERIEGTLPEDVEINSDEVYDTLLSEIPEETRTSPEESLSGYSGQEKTWREIAYRCMNGDKSVLLDYEMLDQEGLESDVIQEHETDLTVIGCYDEGDGMFIELKDFDHGTIEYTVTSENEIVNTNFRPE